jgi:hypothetical protein
MGGLTRGRGLELQLDAEVEALSNRAEDAFERAVVRGFRMIEDDVDAADLNMMELAGWEREEEVECMQEEVECMLGYRRISMQRGLVLQW